jgi:hypothetical protein
MSLESKAKTSNEIKAELRNKEQAIPRTSERTQQDIDWENYQKQEWVPLEEAQKEIVKDRKLIEDLYADSVIADRKINRLKAQLAETQNIVSDLHQKGLGQICHMDCKKEYICHKLLDVLADKDHKLTFVNKLTDHGENKQ